ncbi:MAG TPA: 50S ribosome-binding GTPase [Synergistaceae bacterium]|nr:50S ribosome-binding GTPase [Synergistaceae bacterium]HQF91750.1 50S ribosome-binding GTPase [Synergistaceae bacterium]HQH78063.1 50S ribosome-binding GTPase [Synergistaceae bacterium]HQK24651.1 50S ribosome-binding GTPase [Synergistaceae bacterium]
MAGRTVWYPGHMAKGKRALEELASKLDVLLEVRDARAPRLTASFQAQELRRLRPVWVILAKRDLAEEGVTASWLRWLERDGGRAWAMDLRKGRLDYLRRALREMAPGHREARVAVVGVPNVGKSLLLNQLLGGAHRAPVGGIPGITKGVSWYRVEGNLLVVDSPGILDPKAEAGIQRSLAWLGSSKGEVIGGAESLAVDLLRYLRDHGLWGVVERTWGVCPSEIPEGAEEPDDLDLLGRRLGCLLRGNRVDRELAGRRLLDAFSQGKVGPLSLERPGEGGGGA